jgi:hypothetical protein
MPSFALSLALSFTHTHTHTRTHTHTLTVTLNSLCYSINCDPNIHRFKLLDDGAYLLISRERQVMAAAGPLNPL